MRLYLTYLIIICAGFHAIGQQDVLFTQFAYDKLGFNPGFAGAYDHTSLTAIYRNQWIGLNGSPNRFSGSVNLPVFKEHVGLGLHIDQSSISIFDLTSIEASYAYQIRTSEGNLSIGLSTSFRQFRADWTDSNLNPIDGWANDHAINPNAYSKSIFNFGAGAYFNTDQFFIGASIPRIRKSDIDFDQATLDTLSARETRLFYMMTGGIFAVHHQIDLHPQLLFVLPSEGPMQIELSIIGILDDTFHAGINFSSGGISQPLIESLDLILGWQYNSKLFFGISYDMGVNKLRNSNKGTLELTANYRFKKDSDIQITINPRYF